MPADMALNISVDEKITGRFLTMAACRDIDFTPIAYQLVTPRSPLSPRGEFQAPSP